MAYTAIGLRGKKGLSLSQQSSEQITQRFTQYENNSYKANFLIRDTVKTLLPFVTTCLCESGFFALARIKSKTRNFLEFEDDMRLALSKIAPNFDEIVETKQSEGPH